MMSRGMNCAVSVSVSPASPETVWQPRTVICSALGLLQPPANESCPVYDPASNHSESPSQHAAAVTAEMKKL